MPAQTDGQKPFFLIKSDGDSYKLLPGSDGTFKIAAARSEDEFYDKFKTIAGAFDRVAKSIEDVNKSIDALRDAINDMSDPQFSEIELEQKGFLLGIVSKNIPIRSI